MHYTNGKGIAKLNLKNFEYIRWTNASGCAISQKYSILAMVESSVYDNKKKHDFTSYVGKNFLLPTERAKTYSLWVFEATENWWNSFCIWNGFRLVCIVRQRYNSAMTANGFVSCWLCCGSYYKAVQQRKLCWCDKHAIIHNRNCK